MNFNLNYFFNTRRTRLHGNTLLFKANTTLTLTLFNPPPCQSAHMFGMALPVPWIVLSRNGMVVTVCVSNVQQKTTIILCAHFRKNAM